MVVQDITAKHEEFLHPDPDSHQQQEDPQVNISLAVTDLTLKAFG